MSNERDAWKGETCESNAVEYLVYLYAVALVLSEVPSGWKTSETLLMQWRSSVGVL